MSIRSALGSQTGRAIPPDGQGFRGPPRHPQAPKPPRVSSGMFRPSLTLIAQQPPLHTETGPALLSLRSPALSAQPPGGGRDRERALVAGQSRPTAARGRNLAVQRAAPAGSAKSLCMRQEPWRARSLPRVPISSARESCVPEPASTARFLGEAASGKPRFSSPPPTYFSLPSPSRILLPLSRSLT